MKIDGEEVSLRALTLREYRACAAITDQTTADALALAFASGLPQERVEAWLDRVSLGTSSAVIGALMELSALDEEAGFPDGQGHDAQPERARV